MILLRYGSLDLFLVGIGKVHLDIVNHVKITGDGEFYLNDRYVLTFSARYSEMERTLASDEYFLVGDNEAESLDSRSEEFPRVTKKDIVGKVKYRLFPKIEKIK